MAKVFDDFTEVQQLALAKGYSRAIKKLYANIARNHDEVRSTDLQKVYDSDYAANVDEEPAIEEYHGYPVNANILFAFRTLSEVSDKEQISVLDFGCGAGTLSFPLALMGFSVTGLDFSKPAVDKANERARALDLHNRIQFSTRALSQINASFDYIIMSDVVEHLSDKELEEIFATCRQITNAGGSIIIHTPNGRSSKYKYCRERLRIFDLYYELKLRRNMWFGDKMAFLKDAYYDQTHINVMGPKHLKKLLNDAGFMDVRISFDTDVPAFLRWLDLGTMCAIAR